MDEGSMKKGASSHWSSIGWAGKAADGFWLSEGKLVRSLKADSQTLLTPIAWISQPAKPSRVALGASSIRRMISQASC
jgi:hypothetical protein